MASLPKISVVILNWNSYIDTKELLGSIYKSNYPQSKIEITVIDNASVDESAQKIKREFKNVRVIFLKKNQGTPARNVGIRIAKGEIIFSIDGDVSLAPNTLKNAVLKIQSDPTIGVLGPLTLTKIGRHFQPSYMNLNLLTGFLRPAKTGQRGVFFLAGSFHAFPRKIIKKVGLYEKKFFFYGDDLDFCLRVRKTGLKVVWDKNCVIFHGKDKSSTNISANTRYYYYYRALFFNVFRHGNLISKITITLFQLLLMPFYKFIVKGENTFVPRLRAYWWNLKNTALETRLLLPVLAIAILLRMIALNRHDFWFDEAFTYHVAKLPIKDLIPAVLTDNNPPLYYLIIHFTLKIGHSEILLRIPSFIFNMLSVWAIYLFLQKLIGRKTALVAASLFAVSPLAIYIATESRLHSLATLILIATTALFLEILKNPSRIKLTAFITATTLGLYTQYYLALLLLPFTIIVYLKKKALTPVAWQKIVLIILLLILPWLILSFTTTHTGCVCPNTLLSLPSALVSPIVAGVGEVTLRSFPNLPFPILVFFTITTTISLIFFLIGLFKNQLIALLYIAPLGFLSASGLFLPVFSPKAFAVFGPIFFIALALGLRSPKAKARFSAVMILIVAAVSSIQLNSNFFWGGKIKPIYNIVNSDKNVPIYNTSVYTFYSLGYYTGGKQQNILITTNPLSPQTVNYIGGQKQPIDNYETVWFIDTPKWVDQEEYQETKSKIFSKYQTVDTHTVGEITIHYMRANDES